VYSLIIKYSFKTAREVPIPRTTKGDSNRIFPSLEQASFYYKVLTMLSSAGLFMQTHLTKQGSQLQSFSDLGATAWRHRPICFWRKHKY